MVIELIKTNYEELRTVEKFYNQFRMIVLRDSGKDLLYELNITKQIHARDS